MKFFILVVVVSCELGLDQESAKKVTFGVQIRSVTLEGEVFDPFGTITGGSSASSAGSQVLLGVQELRVLRDNIKSCRSELQQTRQRLDQLSVGRKKQSERAQQVDLQRHRVSLLEARVNASSFAQLQREYEQAGIDLEKEAEKMTAAKKRGMGAELLVQSLKKDMSELGENRELKLQQIRTQVQQEKAALSEEMDIFRTVQRQTELNRTESGNLYQRRLTMERTTGARVQRNHTTS